MQVNRDRLVRLREEIGVRLVGETFPCLPVPAGETLVVELLGDDIPDPNYCKDYND